MKRILGVAALAALMASAVSADMPRYEDHLLPETSVYSNINFRLSAFGGPLSADFAQYMRYEENVARVLHDAFAYDVVARVITYPSFEPESATALELKDGKYRIFHLESSVQMIHFEELEIMKRKPESDFQKEELATYLQYLEDENIDLPETREDVEISQCSIPLSNALGDKLYALWSEMLFRTRYPDLRPASPDAKRVDPNFSIDGTDYHFSFEYPGFTLAGKIHSPGEESNTGKFVAIAELMKAACREEGDKAILIEMEQRIDALAAALSEMVY